MHITFFLSNYEFKFLTRSATFKFICVLYQFHRQTLPIMKIDRGQIQFQEYVSTGTEPKCSWIHLATD